MKFFPAVYCAFAAFSYVGLAHSESLKEQAMNELNAFASTALQCANHLRPNQCNSLDRCIETKALLDGVSRGTHPLQSVARFTANKNSCCCVESLVGRNFHLNVLKAEGALPHDERFNGCYGQC